MILNKKVKVGEVCIEAVTMAFVRVCLVSGRKSLIGPVHCPDGQVSGKEIMYGLKIFFGKFAQAAKEEDAS